MLQRMQSWLLGRPPAAAQALLKLCLVRTATPRPCCDAFPCAVPCLRWDSLHCAHVWFSNFTTLEGLHMLVPDLQGLIPYLLTGPKACPAPNNG